MKTVDIKVRDSQGKVRKDTVRLDNLDELYARIASRNETLLQINEIKEEVELSYNLSSKDMLELFETLGNLTLSGLRIQNAIDVALELPFQESLSRVVKELHARIQKGVGFSAAFSATIKRVPPLISGMLSIGERSGQLDKVIQHCTTYLRMMQSLREKIVSASMYPAFVLGLMVVGVTLLLFVFIPSLQQGLGALKSQSTAIGAGYDRVRVLLSVLLGMVAIPIGSVLMYRSARNSNTALAARMESFLLRFPAIGSVMTASQLFSLSFTLEVLLESGVPLQEALVLCRKTTWSIAYQAVLADAGQAVKDGASLSNALGKHSIMPAYFVRWISIAERTGRAGQVFGQLRIYYQKQLDVKIARLTGLIEPIMIAGVGMLLLAVISAVVLPLFSIYTVKAH